MESQSFRTFEVAWNHFHCGHAPIAHLMRETGAKHWQRFHSLTESKRYPDSRAEMTTVIERANALAYATLGREDAWLVTCVFEDDDILPPPEAEIERWVRSQERIQKRRLQRYAMLPTGMTLREDEDNGIWSVHAAAVRWGDRQFIPLLREIANDQAQGEWLWMSNRTGAVFAPYDGGVDLFLPTAEDVIRFKARWPDWLSAHPDGL